MSNVYYYPADTVRKTPALIVIASEGVPGLLDIVGEDPDDVGNLLRKQISSKSESTLELAPDFHEGQEFVDDIIGRDQGGNPLSYPLTFVTIPVCHARRVITTGLPVTLSYTD